MLRQYGFMVVCLGVCLMVKTVTAQEIGFAKVPELKAPEAGPVIQPGTAVAAPIVPAVPPVSNIGRPLTAEEMQEVGSAGKDALTLFSIVDDHGGIVVPPHLPAGAPRAMMRAAGPSLDAAIVGVGLTQGLDGMNATERDNFYDSSSRLGGCAVGLVVRRTLGGCEAGSEVASAMRGGQVLITDFGPEHALGVVSTAVSFTGPVGQAFSAGVTIGDIVERRTGAGGKFGVWSYDTVDTLQDAGWLPGTSEAEAMANAERRAQLQSNAMLREMRLRRNIEAERMTHASGARSSDPGTSAGTTFFDGFVMALGAAAQASANSSQVYAGPSVSTGSGWRGEDIRSAYQIGSPEDIKRNGDAVQVRCRPSPSVPGGGIESWCD